MFVPEKTNFPNHARDSRHVKRTPLNDLYQELGAKMVAFAGYEMPVHYPAGIISEHHHVRKSAGLFDVSHMGQIRVSGENAASWLETLLPTDLIDLEESIQRYSFLTNDSGGIIDDLMVYRLDNEYCLVVNAANKEDDLTLMYERATPGVEINARADLALIALQGPHAAAALRSIAPRVESLGFMTAATMAIAQVDCCVTRSGYTGEDGFEVSMHQESAEELARALLALEGVEPAGLGARDTLRLEAGLCLHGSDIGPDTSPVEAGLAWAIPACRRRGGARPGGFPGEGRILEEIEHGPAQKRVGIRPQGKAPVRAHAPLFAPDGAAAGDVTSGGFGPSVGAPIAMAYLPGSLATPGTQLKAQVRNKALPVTVCRLPFVPHRYHNKTKEASPND
ncbi:MAG: glycine cleavage system aminomethyltransferase GcvT [Arenicellales bacterium]